MGGGLSLAPSAESIEIRENIKKILENKKLRAQIFKKIATSGGKSGKIDKAYDISQIELLTYFASKDPSIKHPLLRNFTVNPEIVNEAYHHTGSKKKSGLGKKEFRVFLPTLYLMSELWKIFGVADVSISDMKIFKTEFMRAKEAILAMPEIIVQQEGNSVDEYWDTAFQAMDKDKSGFISFEEFCTYVVHKVITPADFFSKDSAEEEDDDDEDENAGVQDGQTLNLPSAEAIAVPDGHANAAAPVTTQTASESTVLNQSTPPAPTIAS